MKTYDEKTWEEIQNPDLSAGYTYPSRRKIGTERRTHAGTETMYPPNGLQYDVPVYEDCKLYRKYTDSDMDAAVSDKLIELSAACNAAITAGAPVKLSDGSERKFSYSIEDQANVSEMFNAVLMGATAYPYHANGEGCRMYSAADITAIYATLSGLKTAQTTYYNQLRAYVQTLKTVPAVNSVKYGDVLTGEYLETYNTLIVQAQAEMQKILAKVAENAV